MPDPTLDEVQITSTRGGGSSIDPPSIYDPMSDPNNPYWAQDSALSDSPIGPGNDPRGLAVAAAVRKYNAMTNSQRTAVGDFTKYLMREMAAGIQPAAPTPLVDITPPPPSVTPVPVGTGQPWSENHPILAAGANVLGGLALSSTLGPLGALVSVTKPTLTSGAIDRLAGGLSSTGDSGPMDPSMTKDPGLTSVPGLDTGVGGIGSYSSAGGGSPGSISDMTVGSEGTGGGSSAPTTSAPQTTVIPTGGLSRTYHAYQGDYNHYGEGAQHEFFKARGGLAQLWRHARSQWQHDPPTLRRADQLMTEAPHAADLLSEQGLTNYVLSPDRIALLDNGQFLDMAKPSIEKAQWPGGPDEAVDWADTLGRAGSIGTDILRNGLDEPVVLGLGTKSSDPLAVLRALFHDGRGRSIAFDTIGTEKVPTLMRRFDPTAANQPAKGYNFTTASPGFDERDSVGRMVPRDRYQDPGDLLDILQREGALRVIPQYGQTPGWMYDHPTGPYKLPRDMSIYKGPLFARGGEVVRSLKEHISGNSNDWRKVTAPYRTDLGGNSNQYYRMIKGWNPQMSEDDFHLMREWASPDMYTDSLDESRSYFNRLSQMARQFGIPVDQDLFRGLAVDPTKLKTSMARPSSFTLSEKNAERFSKSGHWQGIDEGEVDLPPPLKLILQPEGLKMLPNPMGESELILPSRTPLSVVGSGFDRGMDWVKVKPTKKAEGGRVERPSALARLRAAVKANWRDESTSSPAWRTRELERMREPGPIDYIPVPEHVSNNFLNAIAGAPSGLAQFADAIANIAAEKMHLPVRSAIDETLVPQVFRDYSQRYDELRQHQMNEDQIPAAGVAREGEEPLSRLRALKEQLADLSGDMLASAPVPALGATKAARGLGVLEYLVPTIRPSVKNYAHGLVGGALLQQAARAAAASPSIPRFASAELEAPLVFPQP